MLRLYWGQVPLRAPKVCSFVPKKKARLRNEDNVELISKREDLTISLPYKTLWGNIDVLWGITQRLAGPLISFSHPSIHSSKSQKNQSFFQDLGIWWLNMQLM